VIEDFLRPPRGAVELLADVLRLVGVLGVVVAAAFLEATDVGILAFVLPGLVAPRFLGVRPWPDVVTSAVLLIAAWSNVADLYRTVPWWDLPVHAACAGIVAAGAYLVAARLRIVPEPLGEEGPRSGVIAMTGVFGLALGALWEIVEWFGYEYVTAAIHVTYADTISDLAAGGVGALCAGLVLATRPVLRAQHEW